MARARVIHARGARRSRGTTQVIDDRAVPRAPRRHAASALLRVDAVCEAC